MTIYASSHRKHMDLALARYSGQELHNNYVLTTSPAFGNLRKFFRAAVWDLVLAYSDFAGASVAPADQPSICDLMRQDINETPQGTAQSSLCGSGGGGHSGGGVAVPTYHFIDNTSSGRRCAG